MKKIVLAGGCFWGLEAYMEKLPGIVETEVGYANGNLEDPSYEDVKMGTTGHAEVCYIKYDEEQIPLEVLLRKFWQVIDPTLLNQQGHDIGSQYRTGIYYEQPGDLGVIETFIEEKQASLDKKIVTEIKPLESYFPAEEYHQKYLDKNPAGYCHISLDAVSLSLNDLE